MRLFGTMRGEPTRDGIDHVREVVRQTARVVRAAEETKDVIRDFVHDINAERQRDVARRGE